ncbi:MAG: hypothetical protein IJD04_09040 [Desulfovibrionaceae bacterium]|nr:hypothetical protein [Desulfovibrionaceae bacterium]
MDKIELMRIGLGIYILSFVAVGIWMVTYVKGSGKRFIVCGKSMPLFFICTMLLAQCVDANCTMASAAGTYVGGFWLGFVYPLGLALCLLNTGLFFAKPLNQMNLLTLPDFYFRRYGPNVEWVVSLIMAFSFMILVAGNLAGSGWIVGYIFNLDYTWALIIISVLIFIYTVAGGLFSSAATTVIQIYPACIGFVAAGIWLLSAYGWDYFVAALPDTLGAPENFYNLTGLTRIDNGAMINYAGIMALAIGDLIALDFMERVFSAKSGKVAQQGCLFGFGITLLVGAASCLIGLAAFALMPETADADTRMIMPVMAVQIMPFGIGLLVISGIIGAGASTASGGLLGVSTVFGRNIFQKNIYRKYCISKGLVPIHERSEDERARFDSKLLTISRVAAIPVMCAAIWLAHVKPEPGVLLVMAFDVAFAGCLVPLVLGIYWKKANAAGAMAAIVVGSIVRLAFYIWIEYYMPEDSGFVRWIGVETLVSPLASFVVMWFVSLATQASYPPKPEVVHQTPSDADVVSGLA